MCHLCVKSAVIFFLRSNIICIIILFEYSAKDDNGEILHKITIKIDREFNMVDQNCQNIIKLRNLLSEGLSDH